MHQIQIEKIVYPGKALGRGEDGIATFVEGALPGETVMVELTRKKKTFREARLTEVVVPSPLRTAPLCPSFGKCGGCSFQHADYDRQLILKRGCVTELLAPFGCDIPAPVPSPEQWGYRNKMEFSFFDDGGTVSAGLHLKGAFNRYLKVPPCFIADADFIPVTEEVTRFAAASGLPAYDKKRHEGFYRHLVLRKAKGTGQVLVNLVTSRGTVPPGFFAPLVERLKDRVASFYWTINDGLSDAVKVDELVLLYGNEAVSERMRVKGRDFSFIVSPFSFFQTNTLGAERLYDTVIDLLGPESSDHVLDLYCGTGTIGMTIAPFVGAVTGVEQVASAIENAEQNRRLNGVENISFAAASSVEKWIRHGEHPAFNALVVDPPRGGLSCKVVDFIARTLPEKLVYVSCNPSTLARDLGLIAGAAGYRVRRVETIDMFPNTYHIEAVVSLSR